MSVNCEAVTVGSAVVSIEKSTNALPASAAPGLVIVPVNVADPAGVNDAGKPATEMVGAVTPTVEEVVANPALVTVPPLLTWSIEIATVRF